MGRVTSNLFGSLSLVRVDVYVLQVSNVGAYGGAASFLGSAGFWMDPAAVSGSLLTTPDYDLHEFLSKTEGEAS